MNDLDDAASQPSVAQAMVADTMEKGSLSVSQQKMLASLNQKLFDVALEPVRLGRFVLGEQLGAGGMGVVYEAHDPDLDRRVAVKVLSGGRAADALAAARLLREAQALARLSHPNVVPVYEVGVVEGRVFIVMEFVEGQSMERWVDENRPSGHAILDVYRQAGRGLQAAHRAGMVHRDFKPANVQIGDDGRARVLDFGIARRELQRASTGDDAMSDAATARREAMPAVSPRTRERAARPGRSRGTPG